ncbi:MAG: hypothetical protein EBZ77_08105 [Chitinophagia bacterium]|nr:hypothetical protein [Chitinophagia bacterium]
MKKFVLLMAACSLISVAQAQIKSLNELITVSTYNFNQLSAYAKKANWPVQDQGKMDTLQYTRFIPSALVPENVSDCIMTFYRNNNVPLNYIVYQTLNKKTWEKRIAEVKKAGYTLKGTNSKGDEMQALYVKGKYNVSITAGREKPGSPLIYMVGVRVL